MGDVEMLGRFKIIKNSSPPVLPGKCVVCGTTSRDVWYVDFGFDLDFYGVVYFCSSCITEVARLLEFIPPETWKEMEDFNTELILENSNINTKNKELKHAIDSLSRLISAGSVSVAVLDTVEDSPSTDERSDSEGDISNSIDSKDTGTESGSIESADERRYTDVQHNDSNLFDKLINEI